MLKDILRKELYEHFLTLHVAVALLVCPSLRGHAQYAEQLMQYVVKCGISLYGDEFPVYSIHNFVHLPSNSLQLSPLDAFSALPFENYLQKLKQLVRTGRRLLEQLAKRVKEIHSLSPTKLPAAITSRTCEIVPSSHHSDGPTCGIQCQAQFRKKSFASSDLTTTGSYRFALLKDGRVIGLRNFLQCETEAII